MKYSPRIIESHVCKRVDEWRMETRREYPHSHTCKGVVRGSQKYKHAGIIRRSVFRFPRYFSTVLNSFHYSPETHPESLRGSNSRGCGRSISPRTVTENIVCRSSQPFLLVHFIFMSFQLYLFMNNYES
jgi:hypothetical protein